MKLHMKRSRLKLRNCYIFDAERLSRERESAMKIELLIATMQQADHSLLEKMNVQTDALVVNQCDRESREAFSFRNHSIRFFSTRERGLSKSRNMALQNATGEYLILADDDIVYVDGYAEKILDAFSRFPEADIVAFQTLAVDYGDRKVAQNSVGEGKAPRRKLYNSVRLVMRKSAIEKAGLRFHELFGAGAKYHCGEDTLFVKEAKKSGLRIYESKEIIATVSFSESSWFHGYTEGFFFDKGAWLACAYPRTAGLMKYYFVLRLWKKTPLSVRQQCRAMNRGIKDYKDQL